MNEPEGDGAEHPIAAGRGARRRARDAAPRPLALFYGSILNPRARQKQRASCFAVPAARATARARARWCRAEGGCSPARDDAAADARGRRPRLRRRGLKIADAAEPRAARSSPARRAVATLHRASRRTACSSRDAPRRRRRRASTWTPTGGPRRARRRRRRRHCWRGACSSARRRIRARVARRGRRVPRPLLERARSTRRCARSDDASSCARGRRRGARAARRRARSPQHAARHPRRRGRARARLGRARAREREARRFRADRAIDARARRSAAALRGPVERGTARAARGARQLLARDAGLQPRRRAGDEAGVAVAGGLRRHRRAARAREDAQPDARVFRREQIGDAVGGAPRGRRRRARRRRGADCGACCPPFEHAHDADSLRDGQLARVDGGVLPARLALRGATSAVDDRARLPARARRRRARSARSRAPTSASASPRAGKIAGVSAGGVVDELLDLNVEVDRREGVASPGRPRAPVGGLNSIHEADGRHLEPPRERVAARARRAPPPPRSPSATRSWVRVKTRATPPPAARRRLAASERRAARRRASARLPRASPRPNGGRALAPRRVGRLEELVARSRRSALTCPTCGVAPTRELEFGARLAACSRARARARRAARALRARARRVATQVAEWSADAPACSTSIPASLG